MSNEPLEKHLLKKSKQKNTVNFIFILETASRCTYLQMLVEKLQDYQHWAGLYVTEK